MPSSHLDCARLSARVYKEWDHVTAGMEILYSEDKKIIAFAGTNIKKPTDVLRDMRIFPLWSPSLGLCPAGFLKVSRRLGYVVLDHMVDNDLASVTLTGHSLGGACALITAALIQREAGDDGKIDQIVTFGAPRVGKLKVLTRPISQYRFQNDIATKFPPFMGSPSKLLPLGERNTKGNWVNDHAMINYVKALKAQPLDE